MDTSPRLISSALAYWGPSGFDLASNANVTAVAYSESRDGVNSRLVAARLGSDGSALTPFQVELVPPAAAPIQVLGVGVTGGTFEVAWSNPSTSSTTGATTITLPAATTVHRMNPDGSIPTPASFPLFNSATDSGITDVQGSVFGPQGLLVIRGTSTLNFQRYSPTGTATDSMPAALNVASNAQRAPQTAWNGGGYYASWLDDRAGVGTHRAYGIPLNADTTVPSPRAMALASTASNQGQLLLAGGARMFLALWNDDRAAVPGQSVSSIVATRINDVGFVVDPNGIEVARHVFSSSDAGVDGGSPLDNATGLTFDGKHFLAAYGVSVQDGAGWGVFSIGLDGVVQSQPLPWLPGGFAFTSPTVQIASTTMGSLVAADGLGLSSGFVVGTVGVVGSSPVPLQPSFDTRSNRNVTIESMASDGASYLLVFRDISTDAAISGEELWVWRFDASGSATTQMPSRVATWTGTIRTVQVVFEGAGYLLVWDRFDSAGQGDVMGLRMTRDGSPLTADPFVIAATPWNEMQPSAASDGSGRVLVSYSRFDPAPTFGSMRARARLVDVTHQSSGNPCAATSDCLAGSCVGGVCCDTTCGSEPVAEASTDGPAESPDAASIVLDSGEAPDATALDAGLHQSSTSRGCSCRIASSHDGSGAWFACIVALLLRRKAWPIRRNAIRGSPPECP